MSTVLFLTGTSRGNALNGVMHGVRDVFARCGLDTVAIDLTNQDIMGQLRGGLQGKDPLFALSFAGMGRDIIVSQPDGTDTNLWDALGIPFISVHGDTPAYFYDRHVNPSPNFATFYSFREHYNFRKSLPNNTGLFGLGLPYIFDSEPDTNIDFLAKEKGKLIFLKNSNDPEKLRQLWRANCPHGIADMLMQMSDWLATQLTNEATTDIDAITQAVFSEKGLDVASLTKLRLFFVAQLDDYLRRVKCTLVGEVLSDFPVEIHGENWGHMDFAAKKCTFVPSADYARSRELIRHSLGTIDLSPNTSAGFHDRIVRSYGMHTLCLTNEQECMAQLFGEDSGMTYKFDRENLQQKVADIIARPKDYVELGREASRIFAQQFPAENAVEAMLQAADAMRIANATKYMQGMQDFFVWPPQNA